MTVYFVFLMQMDPLIQMNRKNVSKLKDDNSDFIFIKYEEFSEVKMILF